MRNVICTTFHLTNFTTKREWELKEEKRKKKRKKKNVRDVVN